MGRLDRDAAELAPETTKYPPGNCLCRIVFPESRLFASRIFPARQGVSRTMGAMRSLLTVSAMSTVGSRSMTEEGS